MKIIVDNVISRLVDIPNNRNGGIILTEIERKLRVRQKGYQFSPAFQKGRWDGYMRFFNKKKQEFPTGLLFMIKEIIEEVGEEYEIEDIRETLNISVPNEITLLEPSIADGFITLRDYQYESVKNALECKRGIVNVATNGGKTEIACAIMKLLLPYLNDRRILFVTHNSEIFNQSAKRIEKRLGVKVGMVGNGKWDVRPITVVMIPTVSKYIKKPQKKEIKYTGEVKVLKYFLDELGDNVENINKKGLIKLINAFDSQRDSTCQKVAEMLHGYVDIAGTKKMAKEIKKMRKAVEKFEKKKQGKDMDKYDSTIELLESALCFIGDEFHHSTSTTWYDTLNLCKNAIFRFGLTGTVDKEDEVLYMRLLSCSGEIVHRVSNDYLINKGFSAKPTIKLATVEKPFIPDGLSYQSVYKLGIAENEFRNKLIIEQVRAESEKGSGCLVIVNQIEHGEILYNMLQSNGLEAFFTNGTLDTETREQVLQDMKDGTLKILIATSILDEGVDISGINAIWLGAGGKSMRQVLQRVGRGLRKKEDGSGLTVYDYLDYQHPYLTKHSLARYKIYKAEGFEVVRLDE